MLGSAFYTYLIRKFKRTDKETECYQAMTDIIADMRLQFNSEDAKAEAAIIGISTLGDYKLTLPTDFGHLIGDITYIDSSANSARTLNKISKESYDRKYSDRLYDTYGNMYSGEPIDYCIFDNLAYLGPVPDSVSYTYQINYTSDDYTEITSATADVPFTDSYRNVLRSGVLAELHEGLENYEESGYWRNMYLQGLGKIAGNDDENINDNEAIQYNGV